MVMALIHFGIKAETRLTRALVAMIKKAEQRCRTPSLHSNVLCFVFRRFEMGSLALSAVIIKFSVLKKMSCWPNSVQAVSRQCASVGRGIDGLRRQIKRRRSLQKTNVLSGRFRIAAPYPMPIFHAFHNSNHDYKCLVFVNYKAWRNEFPDLRAT